MCMFDVWSDTRITKLHSTFEAISKLRNFIQHSKRTMRCLANFVLLVMNIYMMYVATIKERMEEQQVQELGQWNNSPYDMRTCCLSVETDALGEYRKLYCFIGKIRQSHKSKSHVKSNHSTLAHVHFVRPKIFVRSMSFERWKILKHIYYVPIPSPLNDKDSPSRKKGCVSLRFWPFLG